MLCSALAVPALVSCELDQYPETSLPVEKAWSKVSDATNFNTGLLSAMRGVTGGAYATTSEAQSDLFNLISTGTSHFMIANWTFTTSQFDGDIVWSGNYNLIVNANNIINNISRINVEPGSIDAATLKEYKATAYFARAYAYANMVTRYCKNYDPATAETTLGLPIVTGVDVNAKPARASLAATYKRITDDLDSAKVNFVDHSAMDVTAPNYNATKALEARVMLQMKQYQAAIDAAKEVMASYPLINNEGEFTEMWANDMGSEIIFQPIQTQDERVNTYGDFIGWDVVYSVFAPQYVPTQGLIDLYEVSDYRSAVYFAQAPASSGTILDDDVYLLAKYPGNVSLLKQGEVEGQTFFNMTKAFRSAEMYLIAAEAQYNLDQTEGGFLNTLRAARGASNVTATGSELFKVIKDEWARELCGEGFRLDCLKRWGEGFTRMTPQTLEDGFLNKQNGYQNLTVAADNYKFVWEIPTQDLQANGNLQRNWPTDN